jgi:hypothetical protein
MTCPSPLVRRMCQRKGNNANISLWPPSRVQKMFCQNYSNGCRSETLTSSLRCLSGQNPSTEACKWVPLDVVSFSVYDWKSMVSCATVILIVFGHIQHIRNIW